MKVQQHTLEELEAAIVEWDAYTQTPRGQLEALVEELSSVQQQLEFMKTRLAGLLRRPTRDWKPSCPPYAAVDMRRYTRLVKAKRNQEPKGKPQ